MFQYFHRADKKKKKKKKKKEEKEGLFVCCLSMDVLREFGSSFSAGASDSFRFGWSAFSLLKLAAYQRLLLHNLLLFFGSYAAFVFWVIPNVQREVAALESSSFVVSLVSLLFGSSSVLLVFWLLPLYVYSVFCNAMWHNSIATFMMMRAKIRPSLNAHVSPGASAADPVYRVVVYNAMLGLSVLSGHLPFFVGPVLQAVLYSLLYGLYCFEFKWVAEGWSANQCLEFLDQRWIYFAGFGAPLTLIGYTQSSFFAAYPITSVLVPFFCISTLSATPAKQFLVPPLRFRQVSEAVSLRRIVDSIGSKRRKRREKSGMK